MTATDELRRVAAKTECANGRCEKLYRGDLERIADRIDAEHESAWIRLPVDADGVPIRPGDELVIFETGEHIRAYDIELCDDGRWLVCDDETMDSIHPDRLRHRAPTVEDVLDEFANAVLGCDNTEESVQRVIAEFAAKLRLAGEGE